MSKKKLKQLVVNEVSGVDRGANEGAKVALWKREKTGQNSGENNMTPEELEKRLAELEKSNSELSVLAKMTDAEKSHFESLEGEAQADFLKADSETRQTLIENAKKKKEEEEKMGDLKKGDSESNQILKQAQDNLSAEIKKREALEARIEKMETEKQFNDFKDSIVKRIPDIKSDAKADLAKSLYEMEDTLRESVIKELESANKVKEDYFFEKGTAQQGSDDPESQLEGLVKAYMDKHSVDYTKAYQAVTATQEGAVLYNKALDHRN